jgi:hypothetical protein
MSTHQLEIDPVLADRLRTTLAAVADTVTVESAPVAAGPSGAPRPSRERRRRVTTAAGATLATVSLAAFAVIESGPEYIAELPPPNVIGTGEIEGVRYWMVPSFHEDACGQPMAGVEIVSAVTNQVGQEWSTGGMAYGDQVDGPLTGCSAWDETAWLADPSRVAVSWMHLGEDTEGPWAGMVAVHPEVTQLIVEADGLAVPPVATRPRPDAPDGPRYGAVGVPEDTGVVTITLEDGTGRAVAVVERDLAALRSPAAD